MVISGRNVNSILEEATMTILHGGVRQGSRNGGVMSYPSVFMTEVTHPCERVLFNEWRAINPFLHLIDGLSILSSVDSVVPLSDIVPRFMEFSDDGRTLRGHYGARLFEQTFHAIDMLRRDPLSRRVAMNIWDHVEDLNVDSKDIPCNVMVIPRVIGGRLDLAVFNRSNDLFWGMLGANVVQFSFLQEFLALGVGVEVGSLRQISTNAHIYTGFGPGKDITEGIHLNGREYERRAVSTVPLGTDHTEVRVDAQNLMHALSSRSALPEFSMPFFRDVVSPMMHAFREHKKGDTEAVDILPDNNVDWIVLGRQWLNKRRKTA